MSVPSPNVPSDGDQPSVNVPNLTDESVIALTKEMGHAHWYVDNRFT